MRLEAMLLSQSILHNGIHDAYGISLRQHRAPCLNRFGSAFLHPILTSRHTQSLNILEKQPTEEISAWMSLQCTSEQLRLVHSRRSRTHRGSNKSSCAAARENDFTPVPSDKDILNSDTAVGTELDMLTDEPTTFVDATDTNNEWYETQLVDRCKLIAIGGRGGNGCVSFRREKHVPLGGADGGNGGPGGSVYLICDDEISNLNHVKKLYIYKAESGNHGLGGRRNGAKGKHCYIPVPPGTYVYNKEGKLYAILQRKGDTLMLVRGGRGGKGNRYYKTKFNPTPHVCELGEEGFKRELLLNYKMLGNLALIGKPNSGKSSLLRCLSNARPRVSNQAFSTKFPILGVFKINDQADVDPDNDTTQDSHRTTGEINTEINDICRNANNAYTSTYSTALTGGNYIKSEQDESDNECPLIKSHTPNAFSHTSLISEVTDGYKDTDDDVFDDNVNPEHNGDSQYTPPIPLKSLEDQAAYNKDSSKSYSHLYGFRCRNKYAIQNDSPPVSSENGSYILDGETKGGTLNKDKSLSTDLCVDELSSITDELSSGLDTMSDCTTESGDTQDNSYSEDDSDAYLEEDSFHTAAAMEELCDITPDVPTSQVKKQLVIADVPGLIQGASSGKGLGHKFLKHIENSNVLTYVIDSSVTDPLQDYIDVKNEIFTYNPDLLSRLELIILNKIDLIDHAKVEQLVKEFTEEVNHTRIYPVSAKTRANMYMLENSFKWIYRLPMTKKEIDRKPISLAIDDPDDFRKLNPRKFKVEKIAEGKFRIISDYLQRKIPMMRFDIRESLDRLRRILRINRIHLKLKKMGVEQGDTLQIGDMSFCVNELAC